jgi:hypothetical protein
MYGLILQTFMFARVNLVIHHELIEPPRYPVFNA